MDYYYTECRILFLLLNILMLNVIMVVCCYAECIYSECAEEPLNAQCRYAVCHGAEDSIWGQSCKKFTAVIYEFL